ncbi:Acetyltransferase (GNAT) family protein [Chitinophaga rupis]|uniref:Acetyltransferase (GNAT) family protein n=1 Tax=Chitinophaga rupis TaxID=573321 RepID=A0A1H7IDG3_9BACT|nr:GNAT family N-acetyltransferase [Chitinophaga rupis]SEK58645.1 Acetyltransferase (GNAT) family protein [Chitinophaga rupis]
MSAVSIKTGIENMDVKVIHRFLNEDSYWAKNISFELVQHSLEHSFCVGAFIDGQQVGFGRVITDYYTFGWFADFFVLPAHRGKGISKKMLSFIFEQPWSKRLRRIMLNTSDAHGLYRQFQFKDLSGPTKLLEIYRPDVHLQYAEWL